MLSLKTTDVQALSSDLEVTLEIARRGSSDRRDSYAPGENQSAHQSAHQSAASSSSRGQSERAPSSSTAYRDTQYRPTSPAHPRYSLLAAPRPTLRARLAKPAVYIKQQPPQGRRARRRGGHGTRARVIVRAGAAADALGAACAVGRPSAGAARRCHDAAHDDGRGGEDADGDEHGYACV